MKRIEVRDHDIHLEHDLVAGNTGIEIARENRMVRAHREITGLVTPIDVAILEGNAHVISKFVLRANTTVIAGQHVSLATVLFINDLTEKETLLLTYTVFV